MGASYPESKNWIPSNRHFVIHSAWHRGCYAEKHILRNVDKLTSSEYHHIWLVLVWGGSPQNRILILSYMYLSISTISIVLRISSNNRSTPKRSQVVAEALKGQALPFSQRLLSWHEDCCLKKTTYIQQSCRVDASQPFIVTNLKTRWLLRIITERCLPGTIEALVIE
jgi:hypothetical protein